MNTEIVEAIEQYLTRSDRVTQLWELVNMHRENIEAIPRIRAIVEPLAGNLEALLSPDSNARLEAFSSWLAQKGASPADERLQQFFTLLERAIEQQRRAQKREGGG